jgi:hypothetical protein
MRREFTSFRSAFPDWREDVVDFVAKDDMARGASGPMNKALPRS